MIYFDANLEYVGRTTAMAPVSGDYTALFWWNHAANPVALYRTLFFLCDDPAVYTDYIWIGQLEADDKLSLQVSVGGVFTTVATPVATAINVTEPVAYRRSGNVHELWYNGLLVGSITTDITAATIDQLYLGSDTFSNFFDQGFWNFREFTSALTKTQMLQEFASPAALQTAFTDTPLQADLNDDSGNGHHWTLTGAGVITDTGASRYYPTRRPVTTIFNSRLQGNWDSDVATHLPQSPVRATYMASRTKGDGGLLSTLAVTTNQQNFYDVHYIRWQTPPLAEQTFAGTFDMCFNVRARWISLGLPTNDSFCVYKVNVYVTVGTTKVVRGTLLADYVDTTFFPGTSGAVWRTLDAPQALTSVDIELGDTIVIEVGARCISSPTPTPTYPPTTWTDMPMLGVGVNSATGYYTDATDGDTSTSRSPWFQFSQTLLEDPTAIPAPPANETCAAATVVPSLPWSSGEIDTTQATGTQHEVWFKVTATQNGWMSIALGGTNYRAEARIFLDCAGTTGTQVTISSTFSPPRSVGSTTWECTTGTDYYIRVRDVGSGATGEASTGGILQTRFVNWTDPQEDDLYIPSGNRVYGLRDGLFHVVGFLGTTVTGVGFDYTRRPMLDIEDGSTDTSERILIGLHNFDLVEILALPTLSTGRTEIDYIADPFNPASDDGHVAQLDVTPAGELYTAFFGNGYLLVVGEGALPAILNTVSDNVDVSAIKALSATDGDNQSGAPFTADFIEPSVEVTAPWAITVDAATGIIYYTSGGFYSPVGGQTIRRWQVGVGQLSDFATLPADTSCPNPGLKGMEFLPGGGLLVCNGSQVVRLDSVGAIVRTYTPSLPDDATTLVDVVLTADGTKFWTIDLYSTRLFQFNITTGVEIQTVQPFLTQGTLIQMGVYQPDGAAPPPPVTGLATIRVQKVVIGGGVQPFDFVTTGGLGSGTFSLVDGGEESFVDIAPGTYGVTETVPDGYTQLGVTVSNGDDPTAITVADGEEVVVIFTNAPGGGGEPDPAPATLNATLLRMRRLRRTAYVSEEEFRIFYHRLQVDAQVGMGLGGAVQLGTDPQMMVKWSDDGGNTWSNEHWVSLGRLGAFTWRAIWNRLGMGRTRLFEIVVSDPVAWRIVAAYLQLAKGNN